MNTIITTRSEAIAAVEAAAWDESGSAMSGADIWGAHGSFAAPRAASHYTYEMAMSEASKLPAAFMWRTDAASGEIEAADEHAALAALIAQDEWAELDSEREARDIADGAWITIFDADGIPVLRRGEMP